ncbi:hypothetical protein [Vibrio phage vB_VibM_10AMN]|uniref:Uncharacterized protein n=1 Tax=Staphylococcus phage vB_VibM_10AMN12 TaxID=3076785 RepID=A0AA96KSU4_9CAUD|nr:hypothetical protein [Vibrio phage vB_VibM_10AMN]WNO47413.1 hypothetical protein [Staphylococcus phage vB_VibM_10AMN12]
MKKKFDIGDKVRLPEGSKYLTHDDGFQLKGIGEVASVDDDAFKDYPVRVYWFEDNKRVTNCYKHEDLLLVYGNPSESLSQQHNTLDEQSIAEAIKTLSQASQELQTRVAVNADGELTIYSHYHEKELTFNLDSLDQLAQYVDCIKKLDKFK